MPVFGRKRLNLSSANAHIAIEEADWISPPYVDVGGGIHVPHASMPAQRLIEPLELSAGGYFVPDVKDSVHANDTPARKSARKADTIEPSEIKRDMSNPHELVQLGRSKAK